MGHISFLPFDPKEEFPGRDVRVITEMGREFDFDAWMRTQVEVPAEIDVTFEYERYGNRPPAIVARTMKKGKIANVRVPIGGDGFLENVAETLDRLRKTAPAPVLDMFADPLPDHTCGAHVAALVLRMDDVGVDMVRKWIDADLAQRNDRSGTRYSGGTLTIPGAFFIDAKVEKVTLSTTHKSNAIHAKIAMRGGHTIEDDETGSSVKLLAQLPDAMVGALRKRTMGEIVDVPWAAPLTVRTIPANEAGVITFRAFSDNVPFALGDPVKPSEADIDTRIERAFVNGILNNKNEALPLWSEVDTAIVPVLKALSRRDLSVVLAKLELYHGATLDQYGLTGWSIKTQGNRLIAERQPAVPVADLGVLRDREGRKAA